MKHSLPEVDPAMPADTWGLSPDGRRRCDRLADALRVYLPASLVTSGEPKARETGERVAARLGLVSHSLAGLEEHHRRSLPFLPEEDFRSAVRSFFGRPGELVLGEETADVAYARFDAALDAARHSPAVPGTLICVTHGTVIALFVSRRCGGDAYDLWSRLGMPSFVALDTASWRVDTVRAAID